MLSTFPLTIGVVIGTESLLNETNDALTQLPVKIAFQERRIDDWADFLEKLNRVQVDVLIVELENLQDPLADVIRQVKSTACSPHVIVVHPNADAETILRVVRADADEFVYPPLRDDLEGALHRMAAERASTRAGTRPRGKIIGFLSAKGGCGSSTIACHVAAELRRQTELSVLLADFDLQSGIIGFMMKAESRYSVEDALGNSDRMDLSFWKALVSNGRYGLEVIVAPSEPLSPADYHPSELRNILRFVRSNYDWVVVDIGRLPSTQFADVIEEMDHVFFVTTTDIPALHRTKALRSRLFGDEPADENAPGGPKLVLNRVPRRLDMTLEEMERLLGAEIFSTIPEDTSTLHRAYSEGELASDRSKIGRQISKLTDTLLTGKKKSRFSIFSL